MRAFPPPQTYMCSHANMQTHTCTQNIHTNYTHMYNTSKKKKKIEKKDRGTIKETLIKRMLTCLYISQDVLQNKEN